MSKYPDWICQECGEKYGRHECGIATWHVGICDVCGGEKAVTEPRDFGHLKEELGKENPKAELSRTMLSHIRGKNGA